MPARPAITEEGFSVLNDPRDPTADIIVIHGLGGHPYSSFASKESTLISPPPSSSSESGSLLSGKSAHRFRPWKKLSISKKSVSTEQLASPKSSSQQNATHWPRDFLVEDCRDARVLVWGFDSKVTKGYSASNKSTLFGHARDLLFSLRRDRPQRRPLLLVAHSLGGLVVKEMLRRSEISTEDDIQDIVKSTVGVIFMGTPHRGSPGIASLAEVVRNILSTTVRIDSNPAVLRTLGLDSPELELSRDSFITQWRTFDFKVKTFQEATGPSGFSVGPGSKKVVSDGSSSLDDPREHAETLPGNHETMCKFGSDTDLGYRKIAAEIQIMLRAINGDESILDQRAQAFLRTLHFDAMYVRQKNIRVALDNTCNWLFQTSEYRDWIERRNLSKHHGLLWIKGKPGAGKSTLMKEAIKRTNAQWVEKGATVAGFFFNARGTDPLEKSPMGLYQSILHQVLQQNPRALSSFIPEFVRRDSTQLKVEWHEEDLQDFLLRTYASSDSKHSFLFVDALDECDENEVRELVDFFRKLTTRAWQSGAQLNVCLSSRHYPYISIKNCPEVVCEHHNELDILEFIRTESQLIDTISKMQDQIFRKSQGVFLWVVLVVSMLKKSSRGKSLKWMEQKLEEIPAELDTLFRKLFQQIDPEEAPKAVWLVQWILFAQEPMKLSKLHCVLGFAGEYLHPSIEAWEHSTDYLADDAQLEMVVDLSRGLIEPIVTFSFGFAKADPTFQFIHESVRDFFLKGSGFQLLDPDFTGSVVGKGHSAIARTCSNYLATPEVEKATKDLKRHATTFDTSGLLLLEYTAARLLIHIELAEAAGESQEGVLSRLLANNGALFIRLQLVFDLRVLRNQSNAGTYLSGYRTTKESILYHCAREGLPKCCNRLLEIGQDVNEKSPMTYGYPLLAAVSMRYGSPSRYNPSTTEEREATVKVFLSRNADVKVINSWNQTALHIAVARSTVNCVRMLLDHGADPDVRDVDGLTPWQLCQQIIGREIPRSDAAMIQSLFEERGLIVSRRPPKPDIGGFFTPPPRQPVLADFDFLAGTPAEPPSAKSSPRTEDFDRDEIPSTSLERDRAFRMTMAILDGNV